MSPFKEVALSLWELGYSILPLERNSKAIKLPNWARYCEERVNRATLDLWLKNHEGNIGLALGKASNVLAIDFDYDVDGYHEKILAIIGDSPVKKAGAKGWTGFYRYENQKSLKYSIKGQSVVEILGSGRQTVIPPSIHPDTMQPYTWITRKTLADVSPDTLPSITPSMMLDIQKLFKRHPSNESAVMKPMERIPYNAHDEVVEALSHLPADDYELWVQVGMALKDELGDNGYGLWDKWSATSSKYEGSQFTYKKWQSFKHSGIHIETLFWHSINAGYKPIPKAIEQTPRIDVNILDGGTLGTRNIEKEYIKPDAPDKSLVKLIADYINDTAMYPLPKLAEAAAIAFTGALMANKVALGELRTNFYCLGLAASGGGKDHAIRVLKRIMVESDIRNIEIGAPKSGAGLLSGLHRADGAGIMILDEFGKYLQGITSAKASSFEVEIAKLMMELYSAAGSTYTGHEYANHDGKMKRKDIDYPCLNLYAVTTPERFYDSMTKGDALDGFMARFLIWEVEDDEYPLTPTMSRAKDVPAEIIEKITELKNAPQSGNLGFYDTKELHLTEGAKELLARKTEEYRKLWHKELHNKTGLHPIVARVIQNTLKLSMLVHVENEVSEDALAWAFDIAASRADLLQRIVINNISENAFEKDCQKVENVIRDICKKNKGTAMHATLLNRIRSIKGRDMSDILNTLHQRGIIEKYQTIVNKEENPKAKPATYYEIL